MTPSKLSVAIATFNEEANIERCLGSLENLANEIVIADGHSSDKTVEIAKKYKAKVIETTNKPMFHINKNLAIDNCKNDWILLLDADEIVSEDLANEIKSVISHPQVKNAYWINRSNWFLGGYLKKGGAYPDSVIRLFRNGKARLPELSVHEQLKVDGELGHLTSDILHLADPNFTRYLQRSNRYTSQTATEIEKKDPGTSVFTFLNYAFVIPIFLFVKIYIRHRGYRDGFRGFVWALFSSFHHFYAYIKYWEKKTKVAEKYQ
ncbi:glycosyltransferase family 2 protein [Candidatus Curtissbacteria bacterium]|nr:glycosyltransferase family 2 protein [Candidatus Curtissbacteria bacterium]